MRLAFCAIAAATFLASCDTAGDMSSCGDYREISNTFRSSESFPQYYLPSFSLLGLPKEGNLTLAMLSVSQLTRTSNQAVDFRIPKGCFALSKLVVLGRKRVRPAPEFCFEQTMQLMLIPSQHGTHPCSVPICSSESRLQSTADKLSAIAKLLQTETGATSLGSIQESKTSYQTTYEVNWSERLGVKWPIYRIEISSRDAELVVEGVHAALDGSTFKTCRNRDFTSILDTKN